MFRVNNLPILFIIVLSAIFLFFAKSNATPIVYSVEGFGGGFLAHQMGHAVQISGSMIIDDNAYYAGDPIWGYRVESFSLYIEGGYTFHGTGTASGFAIYGENYNENSWHLSGEGDWTHWIGDSIGAFHHADLSLYGPADDFSILAPIIYMSNMSPSSALPEMNIFFDGTTPDSGLWLTRESPIPEPSTLLLIGTGFVGIFGFRRKLKTA